MLRLGVIAATMLLLPFSGEARAQVAQAGALGRLPVKEVTVFKDGHAFVLHEGKLPADAAGIVQMDYLPTPVLGTFWPYASEKDVRLAAVVASPRRVRVENTALNALQLIEANPGAEVVITDANGKAHSGTLVGIPVRTAEELVATGPPNAPEPASERGTVALVRTAEGVVTVPLDQVRNVAFKGEYKTKLSAETMRNLLTLKFAGAAPAAGRQVGVGLMYLQKGLRWIPGYKVTIDGKGGATVALQATLINELTDLSDVTLNLVVGVPTFAFKETIDPMALQQTLANLGSYFTADARTSYAFSNALMTQAGRMGEARGGVGGARPDAPADLGPEVGGAEQSEDLFVQTVHHITLKRGQRMVVPVAEFKVKYRDIYTLDMPLTPPVAIRPNVNTEQEAELARLLNAPKVTHRVRIINDTKQPFTTAPALIMAGDTPLGQGMMTYTSAGGTVDLPITTAVDVKVKKAEKETGRTPNATRWQDRNLGRITMGGTITLTNFRSTVAEVEVTRSVVGHVDTVSQGGTAAMVSMWDDQGGDWVRPHWWSWYQWPGWWQYVNGLGKFTWTVKLEPGKSIDLTYSWHYFWE